MNADEELSEALRERLYIENTFFNYLKKAIKDAVDRFDRCDISTSPEVEESVNISIDGLKEATRRLKEETVLNKKKVMEIKDWFTGLAQQKHLVQDSNYTTDPNYFAPTATPVAKPSPIPPATPIVNATPAPRSLLDRARGMFGVRNDPAPVRPDKTWIGNSQPVGPIYQAEPYYEDERFNEKRINRFGGKRKTRKYRRRV
jgi:hypothetical protein